MKKKKQLLTVLLWTMCLFCIIAGAGFFLWEHPELIIVNDNGSAIVSVTNNNSTQDKVVSLAPQPIENDNGTDATGEDVSFESSKEGDNSESDKASGPVADEQGPVIVTPDFDSALLVETVENPYKDLFLANSDMAAWIKIPDTPIDFPVMWTPEDENYYLYRDFDKQKSRGGCPILDTDSCMDPLTTNLIIHGHNIKGIMFYDLLNYKNQSYFEEHPKIYLYGKDYEHIYEVMAVFRSQVYYTTDTCFKYYKFFDAFSDEEFHDFYDNVKKMSLYDTDVTAKYGDKFITLSTCSSHVENGRFVVVGKEIEPGDRYSSIEAPSTEE